MSGGSRWESSCPRDGFDNRSGFDDNGLMEKEQNQAGDHRPHVDSSQTEERLLRAIRRWEDLPHNEPGSDKTWVEKLLNDSRQHYESAIKVR